MREDAGSDEGTVLEASLSLQVGLSSWPWLFTRTHAHVFIPGRRPPEQVKIKNPLQTLSPPLSAPLHPESAPNAARV